MYKEVLNNLNTIKEKIVSLKSQFRDVAVKWGFAIPTSEKFSNYPSYFVPDFAVSSYTMPEEFKSFKSKVANSNVYDELKQSDGSAYDWSTKCLNTIGIYYGDLEGNLKYTSKPNSFHGITTPSGFINIATTTISEDIPLTINAEWCIFHIVKNKTSETIKDDLGNSITTYYYVNANAGDIYNLPRTNAQYIAVQGDFEVRGGYYSNYNSLSYTVCKYLQAFSATGNLIDSSATDGNSKRAFDTTSLLFIEGSGGIRPSSTKQSYNLRSYPCLSGLTVDGDLIDFLQYAGIIDFNKWDWTTYTGETGFTKSILNLCKVEGVMNFSVSPLTVTELFVFTSTYPHNLDVKIKLPNTNVKIFNYSPSSNSYSIPSANTWIYLADNAPTVEGKTLTTSIINKVFMQRTYSRLQPTKTVYEVLEEKGWTIG